MRGICHSLYICPNSECATLRLGAAVSHGLWVIRTWQCWVIDWDACAPLRMLIMEVAYLGEYLKLLKKSLKE